MQLICESCEQGYDGEEAIYPLRNVCLPCLEDALALEREMSSTVNYLYP